MSLEFRPPRVEDESVVRAADAEFATEGEHTFAFDVDAYDSFAEWVDEVAAHARGERLRPGLVRHTFLLAVDTGEVVGRLSLRHELNDHLLEVGGHVGYMVRTGHRNRGYATAMLRHAVTMLGDEGVDQVLVTCDQGNDASAKVIERCGGVLEDIRPSDDGPPKRRYWIDTSA